MALRYINLRREENLLFWEKREGERVVVAQVMQNCNGRHLKLGVHGSRIRWFNICFPRGRDSQGWDRVRYILNTLFSHLLGY